MKPEEAVERIFLCTLLSLVLLSVMGFFMRPAYADVINQTVDVLKYLLVGSGSGKLALTVQR